MVLLVSASDHVTGLAGATPSVQVSKNGGAFTAISPVVTERSFGWYSIALESGHTNVLGDLVVHVSAAGADPADPSLEVVAYDPNDPNALGLARIDAAITSRLELASVFEGPETVAELLRGLRAVLYGDAEGLDGTTPAFKSRDGSKDRVSDVIASGVRTVTTDLS